MSQRKKQHRKNCRSRRGLRVERLENRVVMAANLAIDLVEVSDVDRPQDSGIVSTFEDSRPAEIQAFADVDRDASARRALVDPANWGAVRGLPTSMNDAVKPEHLSDLRQFREAAFHGRDKPSVTTPVLAQWTEPRSVESAQDQQLVVPITHIERVDPSARTVQLVSWQTNNEFHTFTESDRNEPRTEDKLIELMPAEFLHENQRSTDSNKNEPWQLNPDTVERIEEIARREPPSPNTRITPPSQQDEDLSGLIAFSAVDLPSTDIASGTAYPMIHVDADMGHLRSLQIAVAPGHDLVPNSATTLVSTVIDPADVADTNEAEETPSLSYSAAIVVCGVLVSAEMFRARSTDHETEIKKRQSFL